MCSRRSLESLLDALQCLDYEVAYMNAPRCHVLAIKSLITILWFSTEGVFNAIRKNFGLCHLIKLTCLLSGNSLKWKWQDTGTRYLEILTFCLPSGIARMSVVRKHKKEMGSVDQEGLFRQKKSELTSSVKGTFSSKKEKTTAPRDSHVLSNRSTKEALSGLTSEIGRDPVFSGRYGRSCKRVKNIGL
jgi:hypothetical protein